MNTNQIRRQLEKHYHVLGLERDKLRDLISDMEALYDTCDRAYDAIQEAIDALSEQA